MARKADIEGSTVIRAIHELQRRTTEWPTAEGIADFLEVPVADVRRHLQTLRRKRIFDDRQRRGKRVWMPWERCH